MVSLPYHNPLWAAERMVLLAGKYGMGLLSLGATVAIGMDVLAHNWANPEATVRYEERQKAEVG